MNCLRRPNAEAVEMREGKNLKNEEIHPKTVGDEEDPQMMIADRATENPDNVTPPPAGEKLVAESTLFNQFLIRRYGQLP